MSPNRFNSTFSETFRKLSSDPKILTYGKGQAHGYLSTDTMQVGQPPLVAMDQPFNYVFQTQDFGGLTADGILGLGFQQLSEGGVPLIQSLYNQH